MKKNVKKVFFYLSLASALIFQSCSSKCGDLRKEIKEYYANDNQIDINECTNIKEFIKKNADDCIKCQKNNPLIANGVVSETALIEYIKTVCKNNAVAIACSPPKITDIFPKLYLERSESMTSYHNQNMKSDFKNILGTFLNNFDKVSPDKNKIFVVNDSIYPSPLDFQALINSSDIFGATNIGNPLYTDFRSIFDNILHELKDGEISMLFSDLIYSTKSMQVTDNQQILNEVQNLTEKVFHRYSSNYSLLVVKFHSDYGGSYYPFKGRKIPYKGNRPFYVCLFAKNATMKSFLKDKNYEQVREWAEYPNFENFHLFTNETTAKTPFYTISLDKSDKTGTYRQDNDALKDKNNFVHALQDVEYDRNGKLGITIGVDLSNLYMPENFKTSPQNYELEDPMNEGFKIDLISRVNNIDGITHKMHLVASNAPKKSTPREIKISLKKTFPPTWISNSHADSDLDTSAQNFATTTFGIKNMLAGIDKAYNLTNEPNHFTINIHLKK